LTATAVAFGFASPVGRIICGISCATYIASLVPMVYVATWGQ